MLQSLQKIVFYLVLILTAINIGVFFCPSPYIYLADALNIGLLGLCVWHNKKLGALPGTVIQAWSILSVYTLVLVLNTENIVNLSSGIAAMRSMYPYFLFYFIALLIRKEDIPRFIDYINLFCLSGVVLAVVQSFHGQEPLFSPGGFYNTGHWAGQQMMINGFMARVMLPTLYTILIMFVFSVTYLLVVRFKLKYVLLALSFLIAIFIGYARSQWIATIVSMILVMALIFGYRQNRIIMVLSVSALSVITILFILSNIDIPGLSDLSQSLTERVRELTFDIQNREGNLGSRIRTVERSMQIFQRSPWFGVDYNFPAIYEMTELTDVGFTYMLITTGIVGVTLFAYLFFIALRGAWLMYKQSFRANDILGLLLSILVIGNIILFMITQSFNQFYFVTATFAISFGLYCNYFSREKKIGIS